MTRRSAAIRAGMSAAVVVGWMASFLVAVPVAYVLGTWLSGWEEPPDYIVQGASRNPLLSGAGTAIVLTFVVLVLLATVLWSWILVRVLTDRR